jgi:hypothetical protein
VDFLRKTFDFFLFKGMCTGRKGKKPATFSPHGREGLLAPAVLKSVSTIVVT